MKNVPSRAQYITIQAKGQDLEAKFDVITVKINQLRATRLRLTES